MEEVKWLNRRFPWLKVVLLGGFLVVVAILGAVRGASDAKRGSEAVSNLDAFQGGLGTSEVVSGGGIADVLGVTEGAEESAEVSEAQTEEQRKAEREKWLNSVKKKKLVALTFDDGPNAATTGKLLDVLEKNGVRATFFVVGTRAKANQGLVAREYREGHEVGSHSWAHGNLSVVSKKKVEADRKKVWKAIKVATGVNPGLTRAPYGALSAAVKTGVKTPLINWDVDPRDWADRKTATVRKRVVAAAHDGAVILMHDIYKTSVEAVPGIIKDLRKKGYEFVTVSELAKIRGTKMKAGKVYYNFRKK